MFRALFYKEWIKTRHIILLIGVILVSLLIYTFINTGQLFRVGGAVQTWTNILLKDMSILPNIVKWFPLLAGVLLGLVQFVPEMTDKRMKLTLHLPLPESRILTFLLIYGLAVLLILYLIMYLVIIIGFSNYYASEIVSTVAMQILPWLIAGITGYLFTAWICLEPVWRQRVFNALVSIGGLALFFIDAKAGAYETSIFYLIIIMLIGFLFPFYSTARFKDGAQ